MKRSELKKMIMPIVKECVQETLLKEGLLSNIVSEVAQGMGRQVVTETVSRKQSETLAQTELATENKRKQLLAHKKRLLDEIGKEAYNGIDLFEGTTPAAPQMSPAQSAGPLANKDPNDAGVDISGIVALGGKNWKALMG